ncbi:hypothetical protein DFA_11075 [Cavenderia fasciculata]|uniref:Uncharacterized protein n=1 Tax=Cavenderia fasciculata TaxID=261658 RepID=F4QEQ3_CACFS|nr:uncharacterized protein DFA_11075 [Cavenderia fasciculata]EGG13314.1 hypothetical protein DFA_11075 [Cavenderia fasciculata]|eukprot:XP_004350013.1 hypothetical protein DFA_11075 [Cavenderia fasciculata]
MSSIVDITNRLATRYRSTFKRSAREESSRVDEREEIATYHYDTVMDLLQDKRFNGYVFEKVVSHNHFQGYTIDPLPNLIYVKNNTGKVSTNQLIIIPIQRWVYQQYYKGFSSLSWFHETVIVRTPEPVKLFDSAQGIFMWYRSIKYSIVVKNDPGLERNAPLLKWVQSKIPTQRSITQAPPATNVSGPISSSSSSTTTTTTSHSSIHPRDRDGGYNMDSDASIASKTGCYIISFSKDIKDIGSMSETNQRAGTSRGGKETTPKKIVDKLAAENDSSLLSLEGIQNIFKMYDYHDIERHGKAVKTPDRGQRYDRSILSIGHQSPPLPSSHRDPGKGIVLYRFRVVYLPDGSTRYQVVDYDTVVNGIVEISDTFYFLSADHGLYRIRYQVTKHMIENVFRYLSWRQSIKAIYGDIPNVVLFSRTSASNNNCGSSINDQVLGSLTFSGARHSYVCKSMPAHPVYQNEEEIEAAMYGENPTPSTDSTLPVDMDAPQLVTTLTEEEVGDENSTEENDNN